MPELPEVETTRQGLSFHCVGATLAELTVREPRLRWRVSLDMPVLVRGRKINSLDRRGKYLLFRLEGAAGMILHLGMSGSVRVAALSDRPLRHDHVDIVLHNSKVLRFHDPRRFGSLHYVREPIESHPLLSRLGPEPLSDSFNGRHLFELSRGRRVAVKQFIMDSHVVVGVGNIYAAESLFRAGIHPTRPAGRIAAARYESLAFQIRSVLSEAIQIGGTTLRDFTNTEGQPGYFQQSLNAYGRGGMPCKRCNATLRSITLGQRATVYCPKCQR